MFSSYIFFIFSVFGRRMFHLWWRTLYILSTHTSGPHISGNFIDSWLAEALHHRHRGKEDLPLLPPITMVPRVISWDESRAESGSLWICSWCGQTFALHTFCNGLLLSGLPGVALAPPGMPRSQHPEPPVDPEAQGMYFIMLDSREARLPQSVVLIPTYHVTYTTGALW